MKRFWSLIALLAIATVVVFAIEPSATGQRVSGSQGDTASRNNPDRQGGDTRNASSERRGPDSPITRRVKRDHEHAAPATEQPGVASSSTEGVQSPLDFLSSLTGGGQASTKEVDEDVRAKDEASRSAKITQLPNGIEVDDRFTIRGKGSPNDPYEIPWELLISAKEVYVPKDGREIIPGRVEMLHESWVSITGYVMLPTVRDSVDEFVIMQNQWDGCCLGIPPTAYDSVEVSLTEPVDFGFGSRQYATITGRMTVDPYLFGSGMLLGLYEIKDAKMKVTEW